MSDDVFWINVMGETPKTSGSVNVADVQRHYKLKATQQPTKEQFDRYFDIEEKAALSTEEYRLMRNWRRLRAATTDLFQVQARIRKDYQGDRVHEISLTTEVKERVKFGKYWNRIYDFALATGAKVEWEYTDKEIEHSWKVDAHGEKIPGSDAYGKGHGKLFRQVGIVWTFAPRTTLGDLLRHIKRMTREMKARELNKTWVSVI